MEYKSFLMKDADVQGRTIIGYASTFGNKDRVGDVVVRGAFKKTIAERKPKVFYNHMYPIGSPIKLEEDSKGLLTESKISATPKGDEILELVKDGVINEMSIMYEVVKREVDEEEGTTYLKELKLYEYGPVDFPANEQAVIEGVKSLADRLRRGKKLEGQSIASIVSAIDTLQQLVSLAKSGEPSDTDTPGEPSDDTPTPEPSDIDTQLMQDIGELVHELAEAVRA